MNAMRPSASVRRPCDKFSQNKANFCDKHNTEWKMRQMEGADYPFQDNPPLVDFMALGEEFEPSRPQWALRPERRVSTVPPPQPGLENVPQDRFLVGGQVRAPADCRILLVSPLPVANLADDTPYAPQRTTRGTIDTPLPPVALLHAPGRWLIPRAPHVSRSLACLNRLARHHQFNRRLGRNHHSRLIGLQNQRVSLHRQQNVRNVSAAAKQNRHLLPDARFQRRVLFVGASSGRIMRFHSISALLKRLGLQRLRVQHPLIQMRP